MAVMAGLAILLQGEEQHRQSRQRRLSGNSSNTTSCHSTQRKERRSIYGEQCRGTLLQVLVRLLRYIFVSRRQKGCRDKGGFFLMKTKQASLLTLDNTDKGQVEAVQVCKTYDTGSASVQA